MPDALPGNDISEPDAQRRTLTWTAFVDEAAGRALLLRDSDDRHWEQAEVRQELEAASTRVWVDGDGIPVVVEADAGNEARAQRNAAATLQLLLGEVVGRVSLGSPTLWGNVPGWVWYGVSTAWPPLTDAELEREAFASLQEARDRARRNAARRRSNRVR